MNEMDLKFNKIIFFFSIEHLRLPEMLFDSLDVYLRHALKIVRLNIIWFRNLCWSWKKKKHFSLQNSLNCQAYYLFKTISVCTSSMSVSSNSIGRFLNFFSRQETEKNWPHWYTNGVIVSDSCDEGAGSVGWYGWLRSVDWQELVYRALQMSTIGQW